MAGPKLADGTRAETFVASRSGESDGRCLYGNVSRWGQIHQGHYDDQGSVRRFKDPVVCWCLGVEHATGPQSWLGPSMQVQRHLADPVGRLMERLHCPLTLPQRDRDVGRGLPG